MELYFDWLLLLVRWLHITTAVTWIGTSIFFMWLDRSFEKNQNSTRPGHVGDLWMLHGGGFYHVEKLQMGPTAVPEKLHWFKWESYWTWMSGFFLLSLIFFTGSGTFLLDSAVSQISFKEGLVISLFSIFGSWFFYDFLWERQVTKDNPGFAHALTMLWLGGMTYFLCHTLSGRAAYLHVGAMLGTWMTANVFMRIIPRQIRMVEHAKNGEAINPDWAVNAKNRSTHNTYFTLPVIFIMLSNHFPSTYGHELNWLILLVIAAGGAAIREFFVVRLAKPTRAWTFLLVGLLFLSGAVVLSRDTPGPAEISVPPLVGGVSSPSTPVKIEAQESLPAEPSGHLLSIEKTYSIRGTVQFNGQGPEMPLLKLPQGCSHGAQIRSNEVLINNGRLQNVLVTVASGHEKLPPIPVSRIPVEIDQRSCIYVPRVAAARVGQPVVFINSDPIFHNVKSLAKKNQNFNLAMPQKNQREEKVFKTPELFQTKCSVHPWMAVTIAVYDHPYFAVTRPDGSFEIKGLVPGQYTLEFWHEVFGKRIQGVTVSDTNNNPVTQIFENGKNL